VGTYVDAFLRRAEGCARKMGRELATISERNRRVRLVESELRSVEQGFASGLLFIEGVNRVRTRDPRQVTTWLAAGDPAELNWPALPLLAAYVDLVEDLGYPRAAVRFGTPDNELGLDLAAVDEEGKVLVLARAEPEPILLNLLEALVVTYDGDPLASARTTQDGDAQVLAHQLRATLAPYLVLVAPGARRTYRVTYGRTIKLLPVSALPPAEMFWPFGYDGPTPSVHHVLPDVEEPEIVAS
jgi:hypothetical protein